MSSSPTSSLPELTADTQRAQVRAHYADRATDQGCSCGCGAQANDVCCSDDTPTQAQDYNARLGYSAEELAAVPADADLQLGCGNPFALADFQPGATVLDLGSGAGFDAFIAARALAGSGRVIGVDMTPEMVTRARRNAAENEHANVEFRLGEIEALPLPDTSVDLIISNCVINLSPDKAAVFREIFRVLRPGGRLSLSDVVTRAPLPTELREDATLLAGCIAGTETIERLHAWLEAAGFVDIRFSTKDESRSVIES
ncbi:MAG: arsenite methyltransferase [Candidatus Synoicihabitans palmerolidicus]|nr:arsenite methyltransferase [Candidatus Synoicihabitans palmerolidicus]